MLGTVWGRRFILPLLVHRFVKSTPPEALLSEEKHVPKVVR